MSSTGNWIEFIRLKVAPEKAAHFLEARKGVDAEVSSIDGFLGSELCQLDEETWIILIRWQDAKKMQAAQKITEGLQAITDWIAIAKQFVSFETAEVKYRSSDI